MQQAARSRFIATSLLALACCCAGCANNLLYNEARDKQGHAEKQAAEDVDLVATVVAHKKSPAAYRKRLDTLQQRLADAVTAAASDSGGVSASERCSSVPTS